MKQHKLWPALLVSGLICLLAGSAWAQSMGVERVDTRPGVQVPLFARWHAQAQATLVLFSGGAGGYGRLAVGGWPSSQNFLIRTGPLWAAHPVNVVMVGRPSDGMNLKDDAVRTGAAHAEDNRAILRLIRARSAAPIWLVGTSMGTISATAAAIQDGEGLVAGVVLTSSVLRGRAGAVPAQALGRIRVPVLVVHHALDACRLCPPKKAQRIVEGLSAAPRKELLMIDAGSGPQGPPCEALHHHGFIGAEQEVVDRIVRWIQNAQRG